jgi:DNA-directed RNA polymerase specialized sigma24 family protein
MRSVESIVRGMPDQMRRVYTLKKVYRYSDAQIAERLHIPLDAVIHDLEYGVRFVAEGLRLPEAK